MSYLRRYFRINCLRSLDLFQLLMDLGLLFLVNDVRSRDLLILFYIHALIFTELGKSHVRRKLLLVLHVNVCKNFVCLLRRETGQVFRCGPLYYRQFWFESHTANHRSARPDICVIIFIWPLWRLFFWHRVLCHISLLSYLKVATVVHNFMSE